MHFDQKELHMILNCIETVNVPGKYLDDFSALKNKVLSFIKTNPTTEHATTATTTDGGTEGEDR
jgi:hypothetical protein